MGSGGAPAGAHRPISSNPRTLIDLRRAARQKGKAHNEVSKGSKRRADSHLFGRCGVRTHGGHIDDDHVGNDCGGRAATRQGKADADAHAYANINPDTGSGESC
jgi:hypothetical protein